MSPPAGKGKNINQHSLDFQEELEAVDESADVDFVLKIYDGHLKDVNVSSIVNLLSALNQIIGLKDTSFRTIQEGSITLAVTIPNNQRHLAIEHVQKDTSKNTAQLKRISKELDKYGFLQADISYGKFVGNEYLIKGVLREVPHNESNQIFTQDDVLDGILTRLQKGKDKTDHITIILSNGIEVPAECSHKLLKDLHPFFDNNRILRFQGSATYLLSFDSYTPRLKKYIISGFQEVEQVGIEEWIKNFQSHGDSGWTDNPDPISEWLKERQN